MTSTLYLWGMCQQIATASPHLHSLHLRFEIVRNTEACREQPPDEPDLVPSRERTPRSSQRDAHWPVTQHHLGPNLCATPATPLNGHI